MIKVIGIGAAGNKSMISVMKAGIISTENVMLINSTDADVPEEYKDKMSLLSDRAYGCAKESQTAETLCIDALDKDTLPIRQFIGTIDESTEVILVASTDGGTGCGATPVIADWITNEIGCALRIIPFVGFGIDETGLKNTVSFFTKLSPDYIVEPICNDKFLSLANNNHRKAEELANIELAQRLSILTGKIIVESSQNIDKADLLKTIKKSGFATTEYAEFGRLKNVEDFNKVINKMLDESKSFDITKPSQKRMAVILNLNTTSTDCIDWNFDVLKDRLGYVKEVYLHVQKTDAKEFIAVISSGSLIPKDAIDDIYNRYVEAKSRVSKEREEFYDDNRYDLDDDNDSVYNKRNTSSSGSRFFNKSKFGTSSSSAQVAATSDKSIKEF